MADGSTIHPPTDRQRFRACMAERRRHARGSLDHEYLTRAARTYLWMLRGIPTTEWAQ